MTKWIIIAGVVVGLAVGGLFYNAKRSSKKRTFSLPELIQHFAESTDKTIIDELAGGSLTYVSGKMSIQLIEEDQVILITSEYYFQNEQGEWLMKTNKEMTKLETMTSNGMEELRKKGGTILFEIEAPNQAQSTAI